MDYRVISHSNVTLLIHNDEINDAREAEKEVRYALKICGYAPWRKMRIDVYEGEETSLLIATPADARYAAFAERTFPILQEYLTE